VNLTELVKHEGNNGVAAFSEAAPAAASSPFRMERLLVFLRRYWWIPALTTALGLAAALEYIRWAPPSYTSRASMWETEKLRLPDGGLFTGDAQNYFGTQIELLRTGELSERAIKHLQEAGTNVLDKDGKPFETKLVISQVPRSSILLVDVSSTDAVFSQAYLRALLNEYLDFKKNLRKSVSDDTLASISEQVIRLERELKTEQDALTSFEKTNNLAVLQEEATGAAGYLAKLDTQLSDSELQLKLLGTNSFAPPASQDNDSSAGLRGLSGSDENSSSGQAAGLRSADREISVLKLERDKLSQSLRPKHPKMIKLDAEIERAQRLSELWHSQSKEQLDATRQNLQTRISELREAVQEWEGKVMKANEGIAEADRLKLNVSRVEGVYDRLLGMLQNIDINRNIDQETLSVLQPASSAWRSRKQAETEALEMVIGGLFLGLAIVAFITWRDDRFATLMEVNEKYADVIVGQVPEVPRLKALGDSSALLKLEDDRPIYAESYRNLRSALLFMPNAGERSKVILITSAMPHEGKSTIAANLARTMAMGGSRTLLIDADLRRGYLHKMLNMKRDPGFGDLLRSPEIFPDVVQSNCMPNLSFISRGSDISRPGDLLVGSTLDLLLAKLRENFDYVLVDTSPVFAADDATTLAPRVDGTLFVVRNRFSRSGMVRQALALLCRRQAKILGVVVNGADTKEQSYYYYKHSEYYGTSKVGQT
jgi:capsular exopolysaccharide synthesis family protein